MAPYVADDRMMDIVEALFGPHARISMVTAAIKLPGNDRGEWHADWPFNQRNAGHIPMPYPDAVVHITGIWMLSPFTHENGGTLVVPGSHRSSTNPTGGNGVDPYAHYPTEMQATSDAGSVLVSAPALNAKWRTPNAHHHRRAGRSDRNDSDGIGCVV